MSGSSYGGGGLGGHDDGDSMLTNPALDEMVTRLKRGDYLSQSEVKALCECAKEVLADEQNMQEVPAPVTVVGDIHGQFADLLELFRVAGDCPSTNFLFLGDYVDRGEESVECATLVLLLKVRFPSRVTLLRGNHEARRITQVYGFYDECLLKYGDVAAWLHFTDAFDYLPLAASVAGKYFCTHAGLSPVLDTCEELQGLTRMQEVPPEGPITDLVWSDPDDRNGWGLSPRGAGYTWGPDVSEVWCRTNGFDLIVRSHQLVMEGYQWHHGGRCATVFSAPNYCRRAGNQAGILLVDEHLHHSFIRYHAAPPLDELEVADGTKMAKRRPPKRPDYFL